MLRDSILRLREFPPFNPDEYRVIHIALPIDVYECSANIKVDSELDALAEAVLKFINIKVTGDKEIAELLHVHPDIIRHIKKEKLFSNGYITDKPCTIIERGLAYLNGKTIDVYRDEKTFGNMFVNKADGEVMPFFYEGNLRLGWDLNPTLIKNEGLIKIELPQNELWRAPQINLSIFTEAYHKYFKVCSQSADSSVDEIEMLKAGGCYDVLYSDVEELSGEEVLTLADVDEHKKKKNSYVRIFKDTRKEIYIRTEIVVSKHNPEEFLLLSPFPKNKTTWYNRRLPYLRLKDNGIKATDGNKECLFDDYLSEVTEEFYLQFPKLIEKDLELYVKATFPNLQKVKCLKGKSDNIVKSYYNACALYNKNEISQRSVVNEACYFLETVLYSYVDLIPNRDNIIYNNILVPYDAKIYDEVFKSFNIAGCRAQYSAKNIVDNHLCRWGNRERQVGQSAMERYFFLILEAYIIGQNPFKKILQQYGHDFISKIDYMVSKRNKYAVHNDSSQEKLIAEEDFAQFRTYAEDVIRILVDTLYLYEEGKAIG